MSLEKLIWLVGRFYKGKTKALPFKGMVLIFFHRFFTRNKRYYAIEIDYVKSIEKGKIELYWLVISNAGIKLYRSLIDKFTLRILYFQGKELKGHGNVLWLNEEALKEGKAKIYDKDMRLIKKGKIIIAKALIKENRKVERFKVIYDSDRLLEIKTENFGLFNKEFYLESYELIFNNCGLNLSKVFMY